MIVASYTIGDKLVYLVTGTHNENVILNATRYLKFDTLFYYVTAVICVVRNAMQGLDDHITPIVSSTLEMLGENCDRIYTGPASWIYGCYHCRADRVVYYGNPR